MASKNCTESMPKEVRGFLELLKLRLADKPYRKVLPGFREPVWIIPVFNEKTGKIVEVVKGFPSLPSEEFGATYELHDLANVEGREVKVLSPIPSIHEILAEFDKVREAFRKTGSVDKALEAAKHVTPHEVFRVIAEEGLRRRGYRIYGRDEAPEYIRTIGSPDIIAEKDGKWLLAEVKMLGQLARYEAPQAKLILITNVKNGANIEVWGIEELEEAAHDS